MCRRPQLAPPCGRTRFPSSGAGGRLPPSEGERGRAPGPASLLRARLDHAADVWILHGQSPTILPLDQPSSATRNLHDHEVDKKKFHDTATRCHANGIHFFDGHAGGWGAFAETLVSCQAQLLSFTPHRTPDDQSRPRLGPFFVTAS